MAKSPPLASLSPAARAKRIKILAANPGTRAAIPDKYLPAQYKAGRATAARIKQENATLYNPTAILSGNDLRKSVEAEVNQQINPKISAFDQSIAQLTKTRDVSQSRLAGYSDLYNKATAASAANLSTSGQALAAQLAANAQKSQDYLGGVKQGIEQRSAADAAVRGTGLQDTNPALNAVGTAQANSASAQQDYTNQAAAQNTGFAGLANTIAATAPMRANDNMAVLANTFNKQIAEAQSQRAGVEATRGDLTTQTLDKMRNDQFTNLATMKGLDIKASDLAETVRSNKAGETLAAKTLKVKAANDIRSARTDHEKAVADSAYKQAQIDIKRGIDPVTHKPLPKKPESATEALSKWKLKFAQAHGYLPSAGKKGKGSGSDGGPSLTTNEVTTQVGKFSPAYNTLKSAVDPQKMKRSEAGAKFLKSNPTVDPLYASVALDMIYDGHVSRQNAERLHKRGLSVDDLNLKSYTQYSKERKKTRSGPAGKIPGFGG